MCIKKTTPLHIFKPLTPTCVCMNELMNVQWNCFLVLDQILGPEDKEEADKRREELIREREEQGLPTDEETVNRLLEEQRKAQGKQRRIVSTSICCSKKHTTHLEFSCITKFLYYLFYLLSGNSFLCFKSF